MLVKRAEFSKTQPPKKSTSQTNFVAKSNFLPAIVPSQIFNSKFYNQFDGVAMSSPLAPNL